MIEAEAARRAWNVNIIADEGYNAKTLRRPGIAQALELLSSGASGVLLVAKLDRLSRSLLDFSLLMERARKEGWELVVLDLGVDTTTPGGEMVANVMASFAQYERRLIGQRMSAASSNSRPKACGSDAPAGSPRIS